MDLEKFEDCQRKKKKKKQVQVYTCIKAMKFY